MSKNNTLNSIIVFVGVVFLGLCIVYAANLLKPKDESRYTIVHLNDLNVAIIDNQTNKVYYKYVGYSSIPTDWIEIVLPE